ncbi:MAG TPA: DUF3482 domain-containing protein [Polyangiaceae bacterium]|nr:DUF3482 domain-containing protein [Polyangiaceae bacterium]
MNPPPPASVPVFAVVGRVNRGKSSIIATLAEEDSIAISALPGTTRRATRYDVLLEGEVLFRLIDTPGFEDAARALAWMQRTRPGADQRRARVAEFRQTFAGSDEFVEECELLGPVLEGAAILYVVDGSTPFRENIMAEVEILRWTGQPRMALVNRSRTGEHLDAWHRALGAEFSAVRNFDAHAASFRERLSLLALFRELVDEWRAPLGRAIERLDAEQSRRLRESAAAIAALLVECLTHTIEVWASPEGLSAAERSAAEQRFHDDLRELERRARRRVEALYRHHRVATQAPPLDPPQFSRDLFSERVWSSLGLSAGQLIAAYSLAGATAGGALDAVVGGASLLAGTAVGAALGGAAALWQLGSRALGVTAVEALGDRLRKSAAPQRHFRIGPHQHPNLPFVLLDRALLHHEAIRYRAHALNAVGELTLDASGSRTRELPVATRQRLSKLFARCRKSPGADHGAEQDALTALILDLLEQREQDLAL